MKYYAYLYVIDGVPEYAGKGTHRVRAGQERCLAHFKVTPRTRWERHLSKSVDADAAFEIQTWDFEKVEEASAEERRLIAIHGRRDLGTGSLYNLTDGGEGCSALTEEAREKIRASNRRRVVSAETRARMSAAHTGVKSTPRSELTKQRIREAGLGRTLSASHREAISKSLKASAAGRQAI